MADSQTTGRKSVWLSVISAVGAIGAAGFTGYVTYTTSVLETNVLVMQVQTQQIIAEMEASTERQRTESEWSFKRAELFTKSISELRDTDTSALALLGLWPLFSRDEERKVIVAAALHVDNPDAIHALVQLGFSLDPYLKTVIEDAVRSKNPKVADRAKKVIDAVQRERARKWELLDDLLKPIVDGLGRTKQAFKKYSKNDLASERILLEENTKNRDLLREKADLIPANLKPDADKLVEYYDKWLEEYDRKRGGQTPVEGPVFAGPQGYPFPASAEKRFQDQFCRLNAELNGLTETDLAALQIKQVPTKLPKSSESDKQWWRLGFSVVVEDAKHECLLDKIERVVYIMDERWWRTKNEFVRYDRGNNFEFRMKVWGDTHVKARIFLSGQDAVLREGQMNRREVSFFKAKLEAQVEASD